MKKSALKMFLDDDDDDDDEDWKSNKKNLLKVASYDAFSIFTTAKHR